MENNVVKNKSYRFAVAVVQLSRELCERREYVLSRQLLRSGTSIGSNVHEAAFGQTKPDFIAKLSIALKETHETEYWLRLLQDTGSISSEQLSAMMEPLLEIKALLIAILKTAKRNRVK